jgi:hypothetical protein
MTDDPLTPFGEVIDLAGVRMQRGYSLSTAPKCKHLNLRYEHTLKERRVWCADCERDLDPFDALMVLADHLHDMLNAAKHMRQKAAEAVQAVARLRAVKALDKAWSGNVMAVDCPHCRGGLLPEDFVTGGVGQQSRELELARRARKREQK